MTTSEILDNHKQFKANGCSLAFALSDLQRKAGIIRKMSNERMQEEGDPYAKIHCTNVSEWMQEMEDLVADVLDKAIKEG